MRSPCKTVPEIGPCLKLSSAELLLLLLQLLHQLLFLILLRAACCGMHKLTQRVRPRFVPSAAAASYGDEAGSCVMLLWSPLPNACILSHGPRAQRQSNL